LCGHYYKLAFVDATTPAPGTGLPSPETGSQNRRYRALDRQQRPHARPLHYRKCPQIAGFSSETRKRRFVSDCVVADAVDIERVSASEFPANREINREFCEIPLPPAILTPQSPREFNGFQPNSLNNRTGNFFHETGNF
jgi:hypothetical protein